VHAGLVLRCRRSVCAEAGVCSWACCHRRRTCYRNGCLLYLSIRNKCLPIECACRTNIDMLRALRAGRRRVEFTLMSGFFTTPWTLVNQLADACPRARAAANDQLIRLYWPAINAFLRSSGHRPEEAEEKTQAFFADVVVSRGLFLRADSARGRLRNLLLTALRNYSRDQHRRAESRDVLLANPAIETEEDGCGADLHADVRSAASDPDGAFEQAWAVTIVEEAARLCEDHFRRTGKERHWECFRLRVLQPLIYRIEAEPLEAVSRRLGFQGPPDAAAAVQVVKRRFRFYLQEAAAATVADPRDVDDEVGMLRSRLTPGAPEAR
jgi:DNA-directed RNA polymerase specialized sigma24 family protein